MTDLEMTKLCAEFMGVELVPRAIGPDGDPGFQILGIGHGPIQWYRPLHDDAQAMALMKKLHAHLVFDYEFKLWSCCVQTFAVIRHHDLNRAIVECVAKMQSASTESRGAKEER